MALPVNSRPRPWLMALGAATLILALISLIYMQINAPPPQVSPGPQTTAAVETTPAVSGTPGTAGGETPPEIKDPVSGIALDPASTSYIYTIKGRTFYFENARNMQLFQESPEKYAPELILRIHVEVKGKPTPTPTGPPSLYPGEGEETPSDSASPAPGEEESPFQDSQTTDPEAPYPTDSSVPGGTAPGGTDPGGSAPGGSDPGGPAPGGSAPGSSSGAPGSSGSSGSDYYQWPGTPVQETPGQGR